LAVSEVSFGCMSLQGEEKEQIKLLHQAQAGGINFFDTADLYDQGKNEEVLGKAFKGKREHVILATKVGNQWRPDGSGWDWTPSKAYILTAVDKSLQRLQTSYLDLYQLHGGTLEDPIEDIIEAFELLKEQGKIRHYGISSIRPNVIREYVKRSNLVSVMMQYSLLDRRPEEQVLELLAQQQISVLARGALAQGLLLGKAPKPYLGHSMEEVTRAAEAVKEVAGGSPTSTGVAVRYVLQAPALASAVLGLRTKAQLTQALAATQTPGLTKDQISLLQQAVPRIVYEQHR
jgi:aryl-alcohol dehydrogenase-like predicted oxidoreductase